MKCDPKTLSLLGLHSIEDEKIEKGNHLRWFIGVERGYPIDDFRIYRRPANEKLNWIKRFKIPIDKKNLLDYFKIYPLDTEKEIAINADDNVTTLTGTVKLIDNDILDFAIHFPSIVSYLNLDIKKKNPIITWFSSLLSNSSKNEKITSDNKNPTIRKSWKPIYKYESTKSKLVKISNPSFFSYFFDILVKFADVILEWMFPSPKINVLTLYDGELVKEYQIKKNKSLSIINVPMDELRLKLPLTLGVEVEFLLMEEDCLKGNWSDFEIIETPLKLLQNLKDLIDAGPSDGENIQNGFFLDLIKRRFWYDTDNRYLSRKLDITIQPPSNLTESLKKIFSLYGEEKFNELLKLIDECYSKSGSIYRTLFGQELSRDFRPYDWTPVKTSYNPEELGFLLMLSMDVNIATLLALHCVDRGQPPKFTEKTEELENEYYNKIYGKKWDYMVTGKWVKSSSKMESFGSIFYDLSSQNSSSISGPEINNLETLEGLSFSAPPDGINSIYANNQRLFRVGINWELETGYNPFAPVAFDVYRNEIILESEFINKDGQIEKISPFTPPRSKEISGNWDKGSRYIEYNNSLPKLPPFSKVSNIKGAKYLYIDETAPIGEHFYHVESIDIFGRYSNSKNEVEHDVSPTIPVPAPINLKGEIARYQNSDLFVIIARWDWRQMQRILAPDLDHFELYWHFGKHNIKFSGLLIWISESGAANLSGSPHLNVEFMLQPGQLASIIDIFNLGNLNVLLRCEGRKYALDNLQIASTGSNSNYIVTGSIETKVRRNSFTDPRNSGEFTSGVRGILLRREINTLLRVPVFIKDEQYDSNIGVTVNLVLSSKYATMFSSSDIGLLQVGSALYPLSVLSSEKLNESIPSIGIINTEAFILSVCINNISWGDRIFPIPGTKCFLEKSNGDSWIDWSNSEDWQTISGISPQKINKPTLYPLESDLSLNIDDSISGTISSSPGPRLIKVHNYRADQTDWNLSSLNLTAENLATDSNDILAGCLLESQNFQQRIRNNIFGKKPEIITDVPQNISDGDAESLEGQEFTLTKPRFQISPDQVKLDSKEIGSRWITCTFVNEPEPNDWSLCCVEGASEFRDESLDITTLLDNLQIQYFFNIRNWIKLDEKIYRFQINNVLIKNRVKIEGIEEEIEFEITLGSEDIRIISPLMHVATFDITEAETWDFYSKSEGGEIVYETDVPEVKVLTSVVAITLEETTNEKLLKAVFFPILRYDTGFKTPTTNKVEFYPSFNAEIESPQLLSEEQVRNAESYYLSVRAVALENGTEYFGSMASSVVATVEKGKLVLKPPNLVSVQQPTVQKIIARPGSGRSFFKLNWNVPDASFKYHYRIYRISAEVLDKKRNKNSNGDFAETRLDVFNDKDRIEDSIQLRNTSILTKTIFTDVIEGGGAREYYYKILTVDPTGTESNWELISDPAGIESDIEPSPTIGPIHVLNTIPPDKPSILKALAGNNKVTLEWLVDPRAEEYWIYRMINGEYDTESPINVGISVSDLDPVPLFIGREKVPIRFKGTIDPTMDLFFAPDMYHLFGLYLKDDYENWLKGGQQQITNYLKSDSGTEVIILGRDGNAIGQDGTNANSNNPKPFLPDETVWINGDSSERVGPDMAIEYLVEEKMELPGYWSIYGNKIEIRKKPNIAVLDNLFKIEDFDPDPAFRQNALKGTLVSDSSGNFMKIINILDQYDVPVELKEGYRPVIIYREATDSAAPEKILYSEYEVEDGEIELISGPILPIIKYDNELGSAVESVPLFDYDQSQNCIIGVYEKSEYDADPATAVNHYTGGATFDGITINGINLANNMEVIIVVCTLRVFDKAAIDFRSMRIEGYPQAISIESLYIYYHNNSIKVFNNDATIDIISSDGKKDEDIGGTSFQFNYDNPDTIILPFGTITAAPSNEPLPTVTINYIDDEGCSRTRRIDLEDELGAPDDEIPTNLSPYIVELLGIWRRDEYDENNPDFTKELVVSKGTNCYKWSPGTTLISVHTKVALPEIMNGNPVPLVIRFRDHKDDIHTVDHIPGRVSYIDNNPHMNIETTYQIRAVKSLTYLENNVNISLIIKSDYSNTKSILILDPNPPLSPVLELVERTDDYIMLGWQIDDISLSFKVQKYNNYGFWTDVSNWLKSLDGVNYLTYIDMIPSQEDSHTYRLRVKNMREILNQQFNSITVEE